MTKKRQSKEQGYFEKLGITPGHTIKAKSAAGEPEIFWHQPHVTLGAGVREIIVSYAVFAEMGSWLARDACSIVCGFTPTRNEPDMLSIEARLWDLAQGDIRAGKLAIFEDPRPGDPYQWSVAPRDFLAWADGKVLDMDGTPRPIPPDLLAWMAWAERENS